MTDWFKLLLPYWGAMRLRSSLLANTPKPLFVTYPLCWYRLRQINGTTSTWQYCIVEFQPDRITVYPRTRTTQQQFTFPTTLLRWFGRPEKYHEGNNIIWLHLEQAETWTVLEVRLPQSSMHDFVRAMKAVTDEPMIKAYRRQRPYIHYGAVDAYPAVQDIHGAWKLDEGVSLYIMPLYLVIMRDDHVLRAVPLSDIQQIMALERMDEPTGDGLVRFRVTEEAMAFAIEKHQLFAEKLAEAARRSLEEPPIRKQKGYDEEWE